MAFIQSLDKNSQSVTLIRQSTVDFKIVSKNGQSKLCASSMSYVQTKYKFHGVTNKKAFKECLGVLHNCGSEQQFDEGCTLFVREWKDVEPEATRLIHNSFFIANINWFIGCAPWIPPHNNGLVALNSTMKRFQTEHRRQHLKMYLDTALKIVRQRSKEYLLDKRAFDNELRIKKVSIWLHDAFNYVPKSLTATWIFSYSGHQFLKR